MNNSSYNAITNGTGSLDDLTSARSLLASEKRSLAEFENPCRSSSAHCALCWAAAGATIATAETFPAVITRWQIYRTRRCHDGPICGRLAPLSKPPAYAALQPTGICCRASAWRRHCWTRMVM